MIIEKLLVVLYSIHLVCFLRNNFWKKLAIPLRFSYSSSLSKSYCNDFESLLEYPVLFLSYISLS